MFSRKRFLFSVSGFAVVLICGCVTATALRPLPRTMDWSRAECWYQDGRPVDADKVDVFYVVATDVMASVDEDGNVCPLAVLSPSERKAMGGEMNWFRKNIYTEEFNFFSPFYHQVTFAALGNPKGGRCQLWDAAAEDVCNAFDYYMANENRGRCFILAGFSQGASIIRAVLKHMTDEQYSRCVAAYAIGFQVTAEDLQSPHIRPAKGADDKGVIVSFNSVSDLSGKWDLLCDEAACSINPANWRTDTEPAEFLYEGKPITATLDPTNHLVVVKGFSPEEDAFSKLFPKGCLHHYDIMFYKDSLRENAILRSRR